MFTNLFKKKEKKIELYAPLEGKFVHIKDVEDPVFAQEMLGKGMAIEPTNNVLVAPADAKIEQVFDTKHAVVLNVQGVEVLIHVGLDTVKMQGEGFEAFVKDGEEVKKGQKLIAFNPELIKQHQHPLTTVIVVCNHENYQDFQVYAKTENLNINDLILSVKE